MLKVSALKLLNGISVSLEIKPSQCIVLSGPNGTGKSVLLRSLALLHPAAFEKFEFETQAINQLNSQAYRRQVLYIPPMPHDILETVRDYFLLPWKLHAYQGLAPQEEYRKMLIELGFWDRNFTQLSSGEKQFVQLMRALAIKPKILLLDEGLANMDQKRKTIVEDKLADEIARGLSVVLVSHDERLEQRLKALSWTLTANQSQLQILGN